MGRVSRKVGLAQMFEEMPQWRLTGQPEDEEC